MRDRFTNEATLSVWIKMDSSAATGQGMFALGGGANNHYPWGDGKIYTDALRKGDVSFPAPATVDRTQWHHVAVTHKPGPDNWKFYVNGVLVFSTAGQDAVTMPGGRLGHGGYSYAAAAFADFRLYNRALSADEVGVLWKDFDVGDAAEVVNSDTVWRHFNMEGPSFFLLDDPKAPTDKFGRDWVKTATSVMARVGLVADNSSSSPRPWPWEATATPPPSDAPPMGGPASFLAPRGSGAPCGARSG